MNMAEEFPMLGSSEDKSKIRQFVDIQGDGGRCRATLYDVLRRFLAQIFFPNSEVRAPFVQRINRSVKENADDFKEASKDFAQGVVAWTRRGGAWRAIIAGAIILVGLTGLLAFTTFFCAATINALVISLLMSLAAAGGFLALFLACVTAIYVGALFVAVCTVSTITFITIFAVLVTTGWVFFFWIVWQAVKKSLNITKHSLNAAGSAISAYSGGRHAHHHDHTK
ncbi:hypothetical protein EJ110_NYTH01941 [Nymphaea thermarum]|nr:hypothetical protein EJ110_NYTH01941 [Nymphaea thermarum]